jgi:hypothetical protein
LSVAQGLSQGKLTYWKTRTWSVQLNSSWDGREEKDCFLLTFIQIIRLFFVKVVISVG